MKAVAKRSRKPLAVPRAAERDDHSPPLAAELDLSSESVDEVVDIFKLLSDETRFKIVLHLTKRRELHVRALCDILGQSQPAVSHHLALLRAARLADVRRDGKHNYYRLTFGRFRELLDRLFAVMPRDNRHIRLEDYVLSYAPENGAREA